MYDGSWVMSTSTLTYGMNGHVIMDVILFMAFSSISIGAVRKRKKKKKSLT